MALDASQVEQLSSQLRDASENVRLKACDRIAKLTGDEDKQTAASLLGDLKSIFLADANPAVKFMAKKALTVLGESPDRIIQEAQKGSTDRSVETGETKANLVRELPALWRCAQDELRPAVNKVSRLAWSQNPYVLNQLSEAYRKIGTELAAYPLILAFEEEKKRPGWGSAELEDLFTDVRDVIDLIGSQSARVNPAMAAQMGNIKSPSVIATFLDMLRSHNLVLRDNAVWVLAEHKDPRMMDPLLRVLGSNPRSLLDRNVSEAVARAVKDNPKLQVPILKKVLAQFRPSEPEIKLASLVDVVAKIAHPKTFDFVKGCLRHQSAVVRAQAVSALSSFEVGPDERVALLMPLMKEEDEEVLGNLLVALWGSPVQGDLLPLIDKLRTGPPEKRAQLARSLGRVNSPDVVPFLLNLVKDADAEVAARSSEAIRGLSNRPAIESLASLIADPDPRVKLYSIEVIGRHALTEYNRAIVEILAKHEEPYLKSSGVLALGRLKLVENLPIIARYIKDPDDRIRANAIEALEALGEPKVVPLIQSAVMDPSARTRANAAKALWKYGDLWVIENVTSMLDGDNPDYHAAAAYVLGEMADMARTPSRLVTLPLLMMALRRHPKFTEYKATN